MLRQEDKVHIILYIIMKLQTHHCSVISTTKGNKACDYFIGPACIVYSLNMQGWKWGKNKCQDGTVYLPLCLPSKANSAFHPSGVSK